MTVANMVDGTIMIYVCKHAIVLLMKHQEFLTLKLLLVNIVLTMYQLVSSVSITHGNNTHLKNVRQKWRHHLLNATTGAATSVVLLERDRKKDLVFVAKMQVQH